MSKFSFLIAFLIITFCDSNQSTNIECSYTTGGFLISKAIYYCAVKRNPNILTPESAQNCTVSGAHVSSNTNDDVHGIYAASKTMNYFPRGLEKSFKNLRRIYIDHCGMAELHQADLKPFTQLSHIYIVDIIEVVEEGLFEFNPNLEWVGFSGADLIHIDSNVFDHLTKLVTFWLSNVPCVKKHISDSYEMTKEAIQLVKNQCTNSEFQELKNKLRNLEIESKTLSPDEFKTKFEAFERSFITSKFSKYRPLNYKFENLKDYLGFVDTKLHVIHPQPTSELEVCPKIEASSSDLLDNLKNISGLLIDIKSSQCGIRDPIPSMSSSIATLTLNINNITSSVHQLKTSQSNSASSLDVKLNSLRSSQEAHKSAMDGIKESISDIEATLSNVKTSQNDFKSSLSKIKTSQNEIRISLDEIKGGKCESSGDELEVIKEKLEAHLMDFEVKNAEKFGNMEKEFMSTRHKIEMSLDEKMKGIEKRLTKKFEDFQDKFVKILESKLENIQSSLKSNFVPQDSVSSTPSNARKRFKVFEP
ncbi:unnamed protein product [Chironomus riparius]|uniref:Uncharacterized protein n=1 Tax=Chironomus riparius TaxID=315576 RepID=A0A9N9X0J8_9DIPT|nr:unnamed protein product [Chironomus riparius]